MKITVIGEGAWGTAVASVLANNGHEVNVWCHDVKVADQINNHNRNDTYMPGIELSNKIKASTDLETVLDKADWVFEAIPVKFLRSVLQQIKPFYKGQQKWVVLSKGIENETLLYPSQIIQDVFGDLVNFVVLGGPSLAKELIEKDITGVVLASSNRDLVQQLQQLMANGYFLPYLSDDYMGVQVGGALKNVITLAVGMANTNDSCSNNTQAWLLTKGFAEIVMIAEHSGAQAQTLYGLAGIGDLVLCATGCGSRNFEVGVALGRGETLDSILKRTGYIPEGINTLESIHQLIQDQKLNAPICDGLYQVVFEQKEFSDLLQELSKV
ncbi:NAD(P)-dependent glycerol-3-phosphate dehydrogenase [bacterium]|jgi:glycerol-3-phosphate dehydrogenase (NAD(P)+)|nr:NAD(P)-dependent glycerol-3-phosphate dehydrogenase [bacterium]MBT5014938.1 NAD(P)-dependent glycerol-3-phosphate dehydrogenase [bacterium]